MEELINIQGNKTVKEVLTDINKNFQRNDSKVDETIKNIDDNFVKTANLNAEQALASNETKKIAGVSLDATPDAVLLAILRSGSVKKTCKVIVKYDNGKPVTNYVVQGLKGLNEQPQAITDNQGVAFGTFTGDRATLTVDMSNILDVGQKITKTITTSILINETSITIPTIKKMPLMITTSKMNCKFSDNVKDFDISLIGGGGGGGGFPSFANGGGGAGYITHALNVINTGQNINIEIGAGGKGGGTHGDDGTGGTGGITKVLTYTASGGHGGGYYSSGRYGIGGNGSSGGGAGSNGEKGGNGGSNGSDGESTGSYRGGKGQGSDSNVYHIFKDPSQPLMGGGGGGSTTAKSGGGKGGAPYGGAGSSCYYGTGQSVQGGSGTYGGGGGGGYRIYEQHGYYGGRGGNGVVYFRWRLK